MWPGISSVGLVDVVILAKPRSCVVNASDVHSNCACVTNQRAFNVITWIIKNSVALCHACSAPDESFQAARDDFIEMHKVSSRLSMPPLSRKNNR